MSDAIKGSYSDLKFHKSLGVARISIDVPLEQASKVVALLGTPTLNDTTYVAVARLRPDAKSPKVEAAEELLNGDYPKPPASPAASCDGARPKAFAGVDGKTHYTKASKDWRPFHKLPRSQQAAMTIKKPKFQEMVAAKDETAANGYVLNWCGVGAKRDLDVPEMEDAHRKWDRLYARYEAHAGLVPEQRG